MPGFGWSRLAYLLAVLAALTVLVKLGASPEEPRAARPLVWSAEGSTAGPAALEPDLPRHHLHHEGSHHAPHAAPRKAAEPVYAGVSRRTSPPVFYRPVRRDPPPASPARPAREAPQDPPDRVCRSVGRAPEGARIVFPVPKEHFASYEDTWGAPRPQGGHEGTDLMVPGGTPLYAMTAGTVVPVAGSNANGWNTLGGYAVMIRAAYSIGPVRKGDLFYYAHLRERSPLKIGDRVRPGEVVGFAGDTGEGPEGTRGRFPPHLHLGWYDGGGGRSQLASGAMNPFPLLEWVRTHGGSISAGSGARYCVAPQEGPPVPSVGGTSWLYPDSPGERPDLDTGSSSPHPSPVVRRPGGPAERAPVVEEAPPPRREPRPRPQAAPHPPPEPEERPRPSPPQETTAPSLPEKTEVEETTARPRPPLPSLPSAEEIREWVLALIPAPSPDRHGAQPERTGELAAPEETSRETPPVERPCRGHRPCRENPEAQDRNTEPPEERTGKEPEKKPRKEGGVTEEKTTAAEATGERTSREEEDTTTPEATFREETAAAPEGEATAAPPGGSGPQAPPEAPPGPGR